MPKRRIYGANEFAPTAASTSVSEQNRNVNDNERSWGTRLFVGVGAVAAAGALLMNSTVNEATIAKSHADEVVGAGGMHDRSGLGYLGMLIHTGQFNPAKDTYHPVEYPASIWPLGPETLQQSIDIGVPNALEALARAEAAADPGEPVVGRGYSEGGIVMSEAGRIHFGDTVTPGSLIIDGSPVSSTGLFSNETELAQKFEPLISMITEKMGIPRDYRAPAGTILRYHVDDLWANGANSDLRRMVEQAMATFLGGAHAVQNPNNPNQRVWIGPDGVIQVEFTGPANGAAPGGFTMGGPVEAAPPPEANVNVGTHNPHAVYLPGMTSPVVPSTRARVREEGEPNNLPTRNNLPTSTYGSHSSNIQEKRKNEREESTTRKERFKWEPPVRAGQYGNKRK